MREIAFVTPEVTKRDKFKEKHGTGDDYRLEEYITVTLNLWLKNGHTAEGGPNAPGVLRIMGLK